MGGQQLVRGDASASLARFDGRGWQTVREVDGSAFDGATVLGTAPDGAVWVAVVDRSTDGQAEAARVARFDGTAWTLVELPSDFVGGTSGGNLVLAPDGTLWASTYRGPARYDGLAWSFPYADVVPSAVAWGAPTYAVATDGTVFGQTPTGIARMPAVPRP